MASGFVTPSVCIARDTVLGKIIRKAEWYQKAMFERRAVGDTFDVPKITNSCCLLNCELFRKVGGFDASQILYWTEEAVALRASSQGYLQAVVGDAVVQHEHGSSTKKLPPDLIRAIHVRDRFIYMRKNYGFLSALAVEILIFIRPKIWNSFREISYLLKNRKNLDAIKQSIASARV